MPNSILIKEYSQTKEFAYAKGPDNVVVTVNASLSPSESFLRILFILLKDIFLPKGFPATVSKDYVPYQIWDTLQAFCSTITNTIATKAVLQGLGVGSVTASALGATITWILKDGVGMASRIVFAWICGSRMDSDCKKWRLFADILNDVAVCLEIILLPVFKERAMELLCLTSSLKALVGVAGGATRAAITQHQAINDNMADVSAKDGSQETCVNLIASFVAIGLLTLIDKSSYAVFYVLFAGTLLHLYSNYKAVKTLHFNKLNTERLNYVLKTYLTNRKICSIEEANRKEAVFLGHGLNSRSICGYKIKIGHSLRSLCDRKLLFPLELQLVTHLYRGRKYMIVLNIKHNTIYILLDEQFTAADVLEAYFHAVLQGICATFVEQKELHVLLAESLSEGEKSILNEMRKIVLNAKNEGKLSTRLDAELVLTVDKLASEEVIQFLYQLYAAGWNSRHSYLDISKWRACWKETLVASELNDGVIPPFKEHLN